MYNSYLNYINNFYVHSDPTSVHILSFLGVDCARAVIGQCFVLHPPEKVQGCGIHNPSPRDIIDEKLIYNVPEIIDQNEASIIRRKS